MGAVGVTCSKNITQRSPEDIVCATWNAVQCFALSSVLKAAYQKKWEIFDYQIRRETEQRVEVKTSSRANLS